MSEGDIRWVGGDPKLDKKPNQWPIFSDPDYVATLKGANVGDCLYVPMAYEVAVLLPVGEPEHKPPFTKERFIYTLGSGRSWTLTQGQKYLQIFDQKRPKGNDRRYMLTVRLAADKTPKTLLMGEELTVYVPVEHRAPDDDILASKDKYIAEQERALVQLEKKITCLESKLKEKDADIKRALNLARSFEGILKG
jgi:hypothetical protein